MNIIYETPDIDTIDHHDQSFKISSDRPLDDLMASIRAIGLLSPLILKKNTGKPYTIISGFRRLSACRRLGWRHAEARVVNTNDDLHCLKMAIVDNSAHRELNIIEQAEAVRRLSEFCHDTKMLMLHAKEAGLNISLSLVNKLQTVMTLNDKLKHALAENKLSLTVALELSRFDHDTAKAFVCLFNDLSPTLNHQKEIIRLTAEISKRDTIKIPKLFETVIHPVISPANELDRNQKIKEIRRQLRFLRYPAIVAFEENYRTRLNRLDLPESIQLVPPAGFEGNTYGLNLRFQNKIQFKAIVEKLYSLTDDPEFAGILSKDLEDRNPLH